MKTFIIVLLVLRPAMGLACELSPDSEWFRPIEELFAKTDQVFVGKIQSYIDVCNENLPVGANGRLQSPEKAAGICYIYSAHVEKVIKGTFKEGDIVQVRGRLKGRNDERVFYGRDCRISVGFNTAESYLIFLNAFHPDGYKKVDSLSAPWVKEVSSLKKPH